MRAAIVGVLLLAGCVGFHPRRRAPEPPTSVATDASTADASAASSVQRRHASIGDWQVIGRSVEGRPLRIRRVGHGARRVVWIGGIHGNEREGQVATAELPDTLVHQPGAAEGVTLTILEDLNPDGSFHDTRGNRNGVDLNRNYPASNFLPGPAFGNRPLDQPEARVLYDLIRAERPHLVIVAHSWRNDHFINFDGPAVDLAERFSRRSGYKVKPSDKIAPTPGSLGSWIGRTLQVPILTLEYERGRDPLRCWMETRDAILSVILDG